MAARKFIQYQINWVLLGSSLGIAFVLVVAIWFWHARQVQQIAQAMFDRAGKLEADGKIDEAAQYLFQYVSLRPESTEGRVHLATTYDQVALSGGQKQRAIQFYYQAVGLAPEQLELRIRLAELLLEVGRFPDAETESLAVLHVRPDEPRSLRSRALAAYYVARTATVDHWQDVAEALKKAIKLNRTDVQLAACLADVYRLHTTPPNPEDANQLFDQLVTASPESAAALLARYQYRRQFQLAGAKDDLQAAVQAAPRDAAVLRAAADEAVRDQQWDSAADFYSSLIDVVPTEEDGYLGLGQVRRQQGAVDSAVAAWRKGLDKVDRDNFRLAWSLGDLLVEQQRHDEADQSLRTLETLAHSVRDGIPRTMFQARIRAADFLRAKWWLSQEKPFPAIQILERLALISDTQADETRFGVPQIQIQWLLGAARVRAGQWDEAAMDYERVVAAQPANVAARLAAANAWLLAGQVDEAIQHFQVAQSQNRVDPKAWLPYAQALYLQQLRLPAAQRNWSTFERALAQIPDGESTTWQRMILEAQFAATQDDSMRVQTLLEQLERQFSSDSSCLTSIAELYEKLGKTAEADRVLRIADAANKNSLECSLEHARILAGRGQNDAALAALNSAIASCPAADRPQLQRSLALQKIRAGQLDEGRKLLSALAESRPDDLRGLREVADLSLDLHDPKDTQNWEQRFREVEGENGSYWRYYRARRLLMTTGAEASAAVAEAQQLAEELQSRRPSWPETYLLRGLLAERRGNSAEALDAYHQVVALGGRRAAVFERMISLLYQTQQFSEAFKLLSQLQSSAEISTAMSPLAVAVSLQQADVDRALGLATKWVEQRPTDPVAYIWLGQSQLLAKQNAAAESSLRKATELAPHDLRPWQALFLFYVQTNQPDAAREALNKLDTQVDLSKSQKANVLGQGFEGLGDLQRAITCYGQAPNDSEAQQRLAALLIRTGSPDASVALERAESTAQSGDARRQLAMLLLSRPDRAAWDKALLLAEHPDENPRAELLNKRIQGLVLMRRGLSDDRPRAIQLLTAVVADPHVSQPSDRLLLANLLESANQLQLAREQYQALATVQKPDPAHLAAYAEFLVRTGSARDAEVWIKRLEEIAPAELVTVAVRANWLHSQGRDDEIAKKVEPVVSNLLAMAKPNAQQAQLLLDAGNLYSRVGLNDQALSYLKRAYELSPDFYGPLVACLISQQQLGEALQISRAAYLAKPSAQPAVVIATALSGDANLSADLKSAEPFLAEVSGKFHNDVPLLLALSGVRYMQGDLPAVIELSRRVLTIDPENLLALNNLSSLLAEEPAHREEALSLIDKALKQDAHNPSFLDTKAMILFHQGEFKLAGQLLKQAVEMPFRDARIRFHYALICQRLENVDQARENLVQARSAGLNAASLTPLEQRLLMELERYVGTIETHPSASLSSSATP